MITETSPQVVDTSSLPGVPKHCVSLQVAGQTGPRECPNHWGSAKGYIQIYIYIFTHIQWCWCVCFLFFCWPSMISGNRKKGWQEFNACMFKRTWYITIHIHITYHHFWWLIMSNNVLFLINVDHPKYHYSKKTVLILLMEDILHHLRCIKPWYSPYPLVSRISGINSITQIFGKFSTCFLRFFFFVSARWLQSAAWGPRLDLGPETFRAGKRGGRVTGVYVWSLSQAEKAVFTEQKKFVAHIFPKNDGKTPFSVSKTKRYMICEDIRRYIY